MGPKTKVKASIRCYYEGEHHTLHVQDMEWGQVAKWINCYRFTHPTVQSFSILVRLETGRREAGG